MPWLWLGLSTWEMWELKFGVQSAFGSMIFAIIATMDGRYVLFWVNKRKIILFLFPFFVGSDIMERGECSQPNSGQSRLTELVEKQMESGEALSHHVGKR